MTESRYQVHRFWTIVRRAGNILTIPRNSDCAHHRFCISACIAFSKCSHGATLRRTVPTISARLSKLEMDNAQNKGKTTTPTRPLHQKHTQSSSASTLHISLIPKHHPHSLHNLSTPNTPTCSLSFLNVSPRYPPPKIASQNTGLKHLIPLIAQLLSPLPPSQDLSLIHI